MSVKLLTELYLEFLSLKGDCTGSSESTLVKMPHCLKSHVTAYIYFNCQNLKNTSFITVESCESWMTKIFFINIVYFGIEVLTIIKF